VRGAARDEAERGATCTWCGRPFSLRDGGGKKQRFCCTAHRSRYWRALRKWASRLFDAGFISIDDLQRPPAECFAAAGARPARGNMPSQRNVHGARDAQN
jgi:hypothetical protein